MKRAFVIAAVAILVSALGIYWAGQQRAAARRLAQWEAERPDKTVSLALSKSFHWDQSTLTLAEFAKLVAASALL